MCDVVLLGWLRFDKLATPAGGNSGGTIGCIWPGTPAAKSTPGPWMFMYWPEALKLSWLVPEGWNGKLLYYDTVPGRPKGGCIWVWEMNRWLTIR